MHKWGRKFFPVLVLAAALSIGCIYGLYIKNGFTEISPHVDNREDRQPKTFYVTHTRYTIWLIGMAFGHILTQYKDKEISIPFVYNMLAWAATFAVVFSVVFGPYNSQQPGYESTALEAATYDAFSKVAWGFALSWIIFACHHGYGGFINGFLSNPIWQVTSRLSFCMYMIHPIMQAIIYGNLQTSIYLGNFEVVMMIYDMFYHV